MSAAVKQSIGPRRHSDSNSRPHGAAETQAGILSIGHDPELLASRAGVLRIVGRPVRSASPEQVQQLRMDAPLDLVVFGHTLSDEEAVELAGYFRRRTPHTKLLMTCFDPRPRSVEALFDSCIRSTDGPATLVGAVRALLGVDAAGRATPA